MRRELTGASAAVDFFNHLNMLYGTVTEFVRRSLFSSPASRLTGSAPQCTSLECPAMTAGPRYEYHWQDSASVQFKRPTRMSAPEYVDCLMTWTQGMLDDETIFPSRVGACCSSPRRSASSELELTFDVAGVPFPPNFQATVKSILRRLFRVYAHIYNHHFAQICALSIEGASFGLALALLHSDVLIPTLSLLTAHLNTSYRHFLLFVSEFHLIEPRELAPLHELNEAILEDN